MTISTNAINDADWNALLAESEDGLYTLVAREVAGFAAGNVSEEERQAIGRRWWQGNLDTLRSMICSSQEVRQTCTALQWDRISLCTAVFDVLLTRYGAQFSTTITALAVRQGVLELCAVDWTPRQPN